MLAKPDRIVDEDLLETIRTLPCMACGITPSDAHHVTTVGAGGGDTAENVMPLCRRHHAEWHQMGPGWMVETYAVVRHWIAFAGREDVLARSRRGR